MSRHWTETDGEISGLATQADAIEVAGCWDDGGEASQVQRGDKANMFSVYFHFSPECDEDPNGLRGAMCIADRDTLPEALAFADEMAQRFGLPIHDYA